MSKRSKAKLHINHRPITRRDFLSQGLIAGTGAFLLPSLPLLAARAAMAEEPLPALLGSNVPRMISVDLSGGANLAFSNFLAGGVGGQMDKIGTSAADYIQAGLREDGGRGEVSKLDTPNTEFGIRMHPDSGFLAGLLAETASHSALREYVDGVLVCAATENDTNDNLSAASGYVAKFLEGKGGWYPAVGSIGSKSGGNSDLPIDSFSLKLRPLVVRDSSSARELTDLGRLRSFLNDAAMREKYFRFQKRLNDRQIEKFSSLGVSDALGTFLGSGFAKLNALASAYIGAPGAPVVSFADAGATGPSVEADLVTAFGALDAAGASQAPINGLNQGEVQAARAIASMVMRGYAGVGTIELGGYDYHGNPTGRSATDNKDRAAGTLVGRLLKYAHIKQVPLMIYILSDGGVVSNGLFGTDTTRYRWEGDSKALSSKVLLVYNPTKKRSEAGGSHLRGGFAASKQMGSFRRAANGNFGVDLSARIMSNSSSHLAQVVAANYIALTEDTATGVHDKLKQLIDRNDFNSSTFGDHYVALKKIASLLLLALTGCLPEAQMSFSQSMSAQGLKTDAEIRAMPNLDDRIREAWRSKLRPYQLAQCSGCHGQFSSVPMPAELRHAAQDEVLGFQFSAPLVRLGAPPASRIVRAFGPTVLTAHLGLANPAGIRDEIEARVAQMADVAGVEPEAEVATTPVALATVPNIPANPDTLADTVIDLGPVLQPPEAPSSSTPKLVLKIGMQDQFSYRIYSVRIRFDTNAPTSAIVPIRVKSMRVRLGGHLIETASTFTPVDTTLNLSPATRAIPISTAAMILPHGCAVDAPCGEAISFSFDTLRRGSPFETMKAMLVTNCAGCHGVSRNYNGSLTMPAFASQANLALAQDQFIGLFSGNPGFIVPQNAGASMMSQVLGATATGQLSLMPPSANAATRAQLKPVMDAWINSIAP